MSDPLDIFVKIAALLGVLAAAYSTFISARLAVRKWRKGELPDPLTIHSTDSEKPRILIVDDDRAVCGSIRALLNGDYVARDFVYPHDALHKVLQWHEANQKLDLAIIDYKLLGQRVTGVQVVTVIRSLYPDTKIVFFSGAALWIPEKERRLVTECWQKPEPKFLEKIKGLVAK